MTRGRITGLDGIRAVAIFAVILFHCGFGWAKGGWLGVDVFFVLSGYLITGQLMRPEWGWHDFVYRRLARLWPALLLLTACTTVLSVALRVPASPNLLGATYTLSPLVMVAGSGPNPYVGHLWSLAIEMQFYLAWGVFMLVARRWPPRRLACYCLTAAAISYASKLVVILLGYPGEAYILTPTHIDSVLIGAALAAGCAVPAWRAVLTVSGVTLLLVAMPTASVSPGVAQAVFAPVAAVFGAALITGVMTSERLGAAMSRPMLTWVGLRSYSLYLWHAPIILAAIYHSPLPRGWSLILAVALSLVAASLSYRWVEGPARSWLMRRRMVRSRTELERVRQA